MTTFVRTAYHQQKMLELEKEITRLRQRVEELEDSLAGKRKALVSGPDNY